MDYFPIQKLEQANLQRTRYLLSRYPEFCAQLSERVDARLSKAVMNLLSYSLSNRETFLVSDKTMIDNCAPYLAPAILSAAEDIKSFPIHVAEVIYPVLYHQYFSPQGTAVDLEQLRLRLASEDIVWSEDELQSHLSDGERMMSALLFQNPFVIAMRNCS